MTPRQRDGWLLIAGLPGVAAPFVPFISWFSPAATLVELLQWGDEVTMQALPWFVPLVVVAWQLYGVVTGRESVAWRAVAWVVATVATVATVLGDLSSAFIFLGPIAANVGLLLYANRRGRSPDAIAEIFLLGAYVATAAPSLLVLMVNDGFDVIGPWLVAWTCLAYVATIVLRLRASDRNGSSIV